jgi:site-specific recombinase XerD
MTASNMSASNTSAPNRSAVSASDRIELASRDLFDGAGASRSAPRSALRAADLLATARRRKLHVGHFAFMRAVVQGVDVTASWARYLRIEGESSDTRVVRSTIAWIRDEFAAAAKRESRFGVARLVRLDASRIGDASMQLPSLDDFAESRGMDDFSQADQIAAYEAEYGNASRRTRRRARLVERQLEALRWLEGLVAQPPRAGDGVAAWLNPALAGHLERADLFTLAQLAERINGIGYRWYASIKALGAAKAERIVDWLRDHEPSTGLVLGPHIRQPRSKLFGHELARIVAPATDIRPLEKFIVPAELDGRRGLYRRPGEQCLLKATNDYEAILAWLRSKQGLSPEKKAALKSRRRHRDTGIEQPVQWLQELSHTQRAYRKEAERFLLWAVMHKRKALSSMSNEDCAEYREFLADPQPRSLWCASRSRERWSPLWRPFEGPLSASAQAHAITILKNLYGFLVDQNYLMGNPWAAVSVPRSGQPRIDTGRSLTREQWGFVQQQLLQQPRCSASLRLGFGLTVLYATGLRLSEIVAATVDDLQLVHYPGDKDDREPIDGWMLRVVGKGERLREVPVPDEVVGQLSAYLESRGLSPRIEDMGNQGAHLLGKAVDLAERAPGLARQGRVDPRQGIAESTFYNQLKRLFVECSGVLRTRGDARGAGRLAKASTHWLRHTHLSHAIAAGMPIEIAQQNAGHASLATTTVYVTSEQKKRMRAVAGFWNKTSR